MSEPVKISALEVENVKRIKAVAMQPAADGLTVIGGANNQGKTSVIDAIAWALGGDRLRPDSPKREGAAADPHLRVELSNGIIVERRGKNSSLKVTDPTGAKGGQMLLDSFVEQLALDLPRFLVKSDKEKADVLLGIIGVGEQLAIHDANIERMYNQRTAIGQMERQKRGAADDMPTYPEAPEVPVSASELIQQQQAILARNGENQRLREQASRIEAACRSAEQEAATLAQKLQEKNDEVAALRTQLETARKSSEQLHDESTAEIEASLAEIEATNEKVRTNQAKARALEEADELKAQYEDLDAQIDAERAARMALLDGADLPLPGLSIEGGKLSYNGASWGDMSGSEQLRVATAIVRRLKPECGFVLVDKLEQMDAVTLAGFADWARSEGLQVIGTRVSTGDECAIVIEDGYGGTAEPAETAIDPAEKWRM